MSNAIKLLDEIISEINYNYTILKLGEVKLHEHKQVIKKLMKLRGMLDNKFLSKEVMSCPGR